MGSRLASVVVSAILAAIAAAQQPQQTSVDLEAIAKTLDPGELPAVLPTIPKEMLQRCLQTTASVPAPELDEFVHWGTSDTSIALVAAVTMLDRSAEMAKTPASLLAEIHACFALATFARASEVRRLWAGRELEPSRDWVETAGTAAKQRARGLGARLLREHPDAREVGAFLLLVQDGVDGQRASSLVTEGLRRIGPAATSADFLVQAAQSLEDLDFAGAATALERAAKAPSPAALAGRRRTAAGQFVLRQRLARAQDEYSRRDAAGIDGQIAHLRMLQATNASAAVAESQRLVAADVAHALPFAILANQRNLEGKYAEAVELIDKAMKLPGRDFNLACALQGRLATDGWRNRPTGEEARSAYFAELRATLETCDVVVAEDASPYARLYRWVRGELEWGKAADFRRTQDLPGAIALLAALPDSPQAYTTLLATARFHQDRKAAREVVLKPIPAALAGLHDVVQRRAEVYVELDLLDDTPPNAAELALVLGDLERVQGDAREAEYLRGIRTWWEATRPAAPAELAVRAREHLRKAQRPFGTPGLWRSACALAVLEHHCGGKVDIDDLLGRRSSEAGTEAPNCGVASLCLALATAQEDRAVLVSAVRMLPRITGAQSPAALHSAMAPAYARLGDARAARQSAKSALDALASADAGPNPALPGNRGVLRMGTLGFGSDFAPHTVFTVRLDVDLWVLPPLPDREQLQRIADGK